MVPNFKVDACTKDKVASFTPIFARYELEYFLWIKLPVELSPCLQLFQLDEVSPECKEIPYLGFLYRDGQHPWIRINFDILNQSVGHHMYKLSFINIHTEDIIPLYFGYIITDDDLKQSYVYMNDERTI